MSASRWTRDLCYILAALNYRGQQSLVCVESFSKPNFPLVFDILKWFAHILQPDYSLTHLDFGGKKLSEIEESKLIRFLLDIGRLCHSELGIRLNLKALCRADEWSCKELMKIAEPIHQAAKVSVENRIPKEQEQPLAETLSQNSERLAKLVNEDGRDLARTIGRLAGELDDLFGKEDKFQEQRLAALESRLDMPTVEQVLVRAQTDLGARAKELELACKELVADLVRLDERLAEKQREVSATKGRLNDLLLKSPSYSNRYDRLAEEYGQVYEQYVSKYSTMVYLKSCVYFQDDHELEEKSASADRAQVQRLAAELTVGGEPDGDTTGPARLLESLLDAEGASKPISASLAVEEAGTGADALVASGSVLAGPAAGRTREGDNIGRLTYAGRTAGLELEGLLNEFVADSEPSTGDGYAPEASDKDEYDDEEPEGDSDDEGNTLTGPN